LESGEYPLGYSSDGRRLVTTTGTNLQHWQAARLIKTVALDDPLEVQSAAKVVLSDGRLVVVQTNGFVRSYDVETGRALHAPVRLTADLPYVAAVSRAGLQIVGYARASQGEGGFCLWDGTSGALIARLPDIDNNNAGPGALSRDGRLLAMERNGRIKVWDLPKLPQLHWTLGGLEWDIMDLEFSADGKYLASSGSDGEARVWEMVSGRLVAGPLRGHGSGVSNVQFSPDGQTLITGGYDHTVRFWNLATGREMLVFDKTQGNSMDKGLGTRLLSPTGALLAMWDYTREALCVESIPTLEEIDRTPVGSQ
jgi:WD40 repeat protein